MTSHTCASLRKALERRALKAQERRALRQPCLGLDPSDALICETTVLSVWRSSPICDTVPGCRSCGSAMRFCASRRRRMPRPLWLMTAAGPSRRPLILAARATSRRRRARPSSSARTRTQCARRPATCRWCSRRAPVCRPWTMCPWRPGASSLQMKPSLPPWRPGDLSLQLLLRRLPQCQLQQLLESTALQAWVTPLVQAMHSRSLPLPTLQLRLPVLQHQQRFPDLYYPRQTWMLQRGAS